jgi:hypothetical protein
LPAAASAEVELIACAKEVRGGAAQTAALLLVVAGVGIEEVRGGAVQTAALLFVVAGVGIEEAIVPSLVISALLCPFSVCPAASKNV